MSHDASRRLMPVLLVSVGLLAVAVPAAALPDDPLQLGIQSPCKQGEKDCACPTDPHNYLTNIPGYVEECKKP